MGLIKKADTIVTKIENLFSAILLALMCIIVVISVVYRYVLELPFPQGEEIARYMMIWVIFFGVSIGTKECAHIGVEAFVNFLPNKPKKYVSIISQLIVIATYCILFVLSINLVRMSMGPNPQLTPQTRFPFWYMYLAMVIGFGVSIIRGIQVFYNKYIIKNEEYENNEEVLL